MRVCNATPQSANAANISLNRNINTDFSKVWYTIYSFVRRL